MRQLRRVFSSGAMLAVLAVMPIALAIWWPWQYQRYGPGLWNARLDGQAPPLGVLTDLIGVLLWLGWALIIYLVCCQLLNRVLGWKLPVPRLAVPWYQAMGSLLGASVIGTTATAGTASTVHADAIAPKPHLDADVATPTGAPAFAVAAPQTAAANTVTVVVDGSTYVYEVLKGDTLWEIAHDWLGDGDRWPEIWQLNQGKHWPQVSGRTTFHDPDLIFPGWTLQLPADARPPATDPGHNLPPDNLPPGGEASMPAAPPATAGPAATAAPSAWAAPATSTASPSADPASPSADDTPTRPQADGDGVRLPDGSWVPWALAAAISAAAARVWLHRRRRWRPDSDEDITALPPAVTQLRQALRRRPAPSTSEPELIGDNSHSPQAIQTFSPPAPGGIGLCGDGAHAAARAAIVAILSSGDLDHPHARGEVVIDTATLATLLGSDTVAPSPWPRLHIAENTDDALTIIEARLLHRSRILDEHTLTDLDTLREQAPDEEALPPTLLVCQTPPPGAAMRAKAAIVLGASLDVSALLLGEWEHTATVDVAVDGQTRLQSGQSNEPIPARLPVLDTETAVQILTTLREAHTGQPPAVVPPAPANTPLPLDEDRTAQPAADAQTATLSVAASVAVESKARLRVLGPPAIQDVMEPGRPLRAKALELAVFLACHPDGMATRDIGEYLEPDARISQADQRVHTNASNLRHVLARAAGGKNGVVKVAGRYRLDAATVDVDVWQLGGLLRRATIATGERRRDLLRQACDLYAPLAEGQDYEWLQPHREAVRRWGTEAHLLLADDLLDADPRAASDLLDKAISLDRYNEALYRKAMHARHALGDADGIRTLLRALAKALADLDAEPGEDTITLATQLRAGLENR